LISVLVALAMNGAAAESTSFSRDVVPILRVRCATCHLTGAEAGKLALHPKAAHENLVNAPATVSGLIRVKPGAPDESYLVMKLEGAHLDKGGAGARMPFAAPPLRPEQIDLIRRWIAEGANDN
jgi:hypothetical protein